MLFNLGLPDEELQPRGAAGDQRLDGRRRQSRHHPHANLRHGENRKSAVDLVVAEFFDQCSTHQL